LELAWNHWDMSELQSEFSGGGFTSMFDTHRRHFSLSWVSLHKRNQLQNLVREKEENKRKKVLGNGDPWNFLVRIFGSLDPDPAIFVNDLKDVNKQYFVQSFSFITF
jgi:hypothetical protein